MSNSSFEAVTDKNLLNFAMDLYASQTGNKKG
jgi:hypothetical protein